MHNFLKKQTAALAAAAMTAMQLGAVAVPAAPATAFAADTVFPYTIEGEDLEGADLWTSIYADNIPGYSGEGFWYLTASPASFTVTVPEDAMYQLTVRGAQILSCEKGAAPDTGFACWVIEVVPVTKDNGPDKVTYYSGYQFCYPYNNASEATASDGQNPMMNFIGNYTNGRAMMTVNCISQTEACIDISWGSSACETTIWKMSGTVSSSNEGVTVTYSNCTKQHFTYTEDGQLISDDIEYENGTGSVDFLAADNNAYWYDAVEGAGAGTSFWYCN